MSERNLLTHRSSHHKRIVRNLNISNYYGGAWSTTSERDSLKSKHSLNCITYYQLFNYTYTIARNLSKHIIFSDSYDEQKGDGYANRFAIRLLFRKYGNMDESTRESVPILCLFIRFPTCDLNSTHVSCL